MARKQRPTRKSAPRKKAAARRKPTDQARLPQTPQPFLEAQLTTRSTDSRRSPTRRLSPEDLTQRLRDLNIQPTIERQRLLTAVNRVASDSPVPVKRLPEEIRESMETLRPNLRRLHGAKVSLAWFPGPFVFSLCADKFGYMSSTAVRNASKLPFNPANQALLDQLGNLMGDPGRETSPDSTIPAGFTYVGQFVDHDITFDVSSSLDAATDANTVNNMRTPALDLDAVRSRPGARSVPVRVPDHRARRPRSSSSSARIATRTGRSCRLQRTPAGMRSRPTSTSHVFTIREPGKRLTHRDHRRSTKRREPDRLAVPSRDAAVPQPGGGPAAARRVHRRHLRRGQEDRDAPLSVGRRRTISSRGSAARPPWSTHRLRRVNARSTVRSACRSSSPSQRIASDTA